MLTRHFIDRVGQIFAVEPNDDMRAQAAADLGHCKSLQVIAGTAHETGLPDHSVHAVIVGRAIQWFDPAPSQAEIRRVLRPGGWLIVLRTPTTDDFSIAALERLRDERISRHQGSPPPSARSDVSDYFGGDKYIRLAYPASAETWRNSWAACIRCRSCRSPVTPCTTNSSEPRARFSTKAPSTDCCTAGMKLSC
jgi:SAM-dependent methyltransferase